MPNTLPPDHPRPVVVLDINVLISALISRREDFAPPARILSAWKRDELVIALSESMIDKIDEVLHRPALFRFLSARFSPDDVGEQIQDFLRSLRRQARITPGVLDIKTIEDDPEDDTVIITAVESQAECIVSGDRHLKNLGSYQNIPILSPAEFVNQYTILP
ncbi:MAG: putative toxin-antitoxin system toxin component, PIN family [Gemmatimonadota bacterium]|nr:putative toxin-antitoxin system toxin component, PIN family [Gemmatimonadota bacterium]MDE2954253.1 putative toxin-antitoxin system toxin component, PIN family [Gemmatimonadota bacterium]